MSLFNTSVMVPKSPHFQFVFIFFIFFTSITTPQVERNGDWNAGGNCIPNANYQVQVKGHFVLHITNGLCVCGCN